MIAYHTDFPHEIIEKAVAAELGRKGELLLQIPIVIISAAFAGAVAASILAGPAAALTIIAVTILCLKFAYFSNPKIKQLSERKRLVSMTFPSIVVEMRSDV